MSAENIVILDGGIGRELERIGAPFSQPFWATQALIEAPEMVAQVHRSYIQSGAQIITTNSYAVVPPHIGEDLFRQRGRELIHLSGKLARQEVDKAMNESSKSIKVAACVPPVFGSYQPNNFDQASAPGLITPFFEEQEQYADLFLAETVSSIEEALVIQEVYEQCGSKKPLWIAFTLQEFFDRTLQPRLHSEEPLRDALQKILQQDIAQAILFNCCSVEDISAVFDLCAPLFEEYKHVKIGAYANAFGRVKGKRSPTNDLSALREDISPAAYLEYAQEWKRRGASIIGGCCGIGPEYIKLLSQNLVSTGDRMTDK